jgi:hypothetical protein
MPEVTLTDALAVWGGITGSVALFNTLRERPRLVLFTNLNYFGSERELECTTINEGRRPAVIIDAGIAVGVEAVRVGRFRRLRPRIEAMYGAPEAGVLPKTLAPWEAMRWSVKLTRQRPMSPESIAFVQDQDGRYVWASRRVAKPSPGVRQVARPSGD